ncbi:Gldg family protein [Pedobacter sp. AW31-3R]|uniref:Gldg family protein n=1 Tax=Pedobacter sp. AW31-3R TaxID=3445781 RepID=UPI003F9FB63A
MKKIIKIAATELKSLFYSPIAWLILTIFTVQTGISFFDVLEGFAKNMGLGQQIARLTSEVFEGREGFLLPLQSNLYLYLPLLTMGLMSRETSSGSIKLLLSSPLKIREIILGKYLAMMIYGLLLIAVLVMFSIIAAFSIKSIDYALVFSGLLGLYLLICTYAAIGLFLSCLTSYQVVAAISTLVVFATLRYIGTVWQQVDFVRDLTYALSISGRTDDMIIGLISSKDVIYFFTIIILFLGFSILRLQADRESRNWIRTGSKYVMLICAVLLVGYVSSRPKLIFYKDMTHTKVRTLTEKSQQVAEQLKGDLTVTTYVNLLNQGMYYGLPLMRNTDIAALAQYQRFIPGMNMKYVYYYDQSSNPGMSTRFLEHAKSLDDGAKKYAKSIDIDFGLFIPPAEVKKMADLSGEDNELVRQIEYKGKKTFLRFFNDMLIYASEAEVTAALKRLLVDAPKIAFVTGNNERNAFKIGDRDYGSSLTARKNRNSLLNNGFDVINVNLDTASVPADICVLVLADPTEALSPVAQEKVKAWLNAGGNMMIAAEPGKQKLINPLLAQLGVSLKEGTLVNKTKEYAPDLLNGGISAQAAAVDSSLLKWNAYGIVLTMPTAAALTIDKKPGITVDSIVVSANDAWIRQGQIDNAAEINFDPKIGDVKAQFPVVVSLRRKINDKEQRIIISGDADFMSNGELAKRSGTGNLGMVSKLFKWFSNGVFPIDVSRPVAPDNEILLSRDQLFTLRIIFLWIMPGLLMLGGTLFLLLRKRK